MLAIFILGPGLTMGTGPSQIPSHTPLGCLLANLRSLRLSPDLKTKRLIFLCNQVWPQYQLDNNSKWPLDSKLDPNILRDLYNYCECTGRLQEIPYVLVFSYLCTSCSPAQVLLATKTPITLPDPDPFPSFNPANEPPPYQTGASIAQQPAPAASLASSPASLPLFPPLLLLLPLPLALLQTQIHRIP
jgi:hypothetical protein